MREYSRKSPRRTRRDRSGRRWGSLLYLLHHSLYHAGLGLGLRFRWKTDFLHRVTNQPAAA